MNTGNQILPHQGICSSFILFTLSGSPAVPTTWYHKSKQVTTNHKGPTSCLQSGLLPGCPLLACSSEVGRSCPPSSPRQLALAWSQEFGPPKPAGREDRSRNTASWFVWQPHIIQQGFFEGGRGSNSLENRHNPNCPGKG